MLKDLHKILRNMMFNISSGDGTLLTEQMAKIDSIKDKLNLIGQLDAQWPSDTIDFEATNSEPPLSDELRMLIHYLEKKSYTKALYHLDEFGY